MAAIDWLPAKDWEIWTTGSLLIVDDVIVANDQVEGVVIRTGLSSLARAVCLIIGTFLGSRTHIELENYSDGRAGNPTLGERLRSDQTVRHARRFDLTPLHRCGVQLKTPHLTKARLHGSVGAAVPEYVSVHICSSIAKSESPSTLSSVRFGSHAQAKA